MRIGISLTSAYATQDARKAARFMIERAAAARRAGLDSLFLGDHHSTGAPYYQNVPMLGRLLAEWGDAPAGCLFLLPLWHPVHVAEQVGTLAAIAKGRFILQCGIGDGAEQFDAMGVNLKHRPSAFEEALDAVRRLLAGETVGSHGRYLFDNARVAPRPTEPLEVWIGATAEPSRRPAARLGDGWLASPGLPRKPRAPSTTTTASVVAPTDGRRLPSPSGATSTSVIRRLMSRRRPGPSSPEAIVASIRRRSWRAPSTMWWSASAPSGRWATPTSSSATSSTSNPRCSRCDHPPRGGPSGTAHLSPSNRLPRPASFTSGLSASRQPGNVGPSRAGLGGEWRGRPVRMRTCRFSVHADDEHPGILMLRERPTAVRLWTLAEAPMA